MAHFVLLPRRGVLGLPICLFRTVSGTDEESAVPSSPHEPRLIFRDGDQARNNGGRLAGPTLIIYLGSTQSDTALT